MGEPGTTWKPQLHLASETELKAKSQERESEVSQSCLTLWEPMDCSLPGSSFRGFSRQEYWSGLPLPSPGDLPNPGIKPRSPALQAHSLWSEPPGKPKKESRGTATRECWRQHLCFPSLVFGKILGLVLYWEVVVITFWSNLKNWSWNNALAFISASFLCSGSFKTFTVPHFSGDAKMQRKGNKS